jgi:hypothetical protein
LIQPLHDGATVHLAAEVDMHRFGQKAQRDGPLALGLIILRHASSY